MAMHEFELINEFFVRESRAAGVVLGIGDDCALLDVPVGQQLAVSMDTLNAGVHFPVDAAPQLIAERALCVNLSDLAAMGATPKWFTLALSLPEPDVDWLSDFSRGLFDVARAFDIALVGGDTTRGPLAITIQVHGVVDADRALRRSGARIGDGVYVTGALGDGAAALALLQDGMACDADAKRYLLRRFYRPEPQVQTGRRLLGLASAAIDVSDGLLADLGHICTQSKVSAVIAVEDLPLSLVLQQQIASEKVSEQQARNWALTGGDDYQLCFTVPACQVDAINVLIGASQLSAIKIGEIVKGCDAEEHSVEVVSQGKKIDLEVMGYQHF
jgi:thiamine-monophosphate kinase